MRCPGAAVLTALASDRPVRLVLMSATTPPTRLMPSQMAMYSGRFGISRPTTSPDEPMVGSARIAIRSQRAARGRRRMRRRAPR